MSRPASKLSPESLWLLHFLAKRHPLGIGAVTPLPTPEYLKASVKMRHMNGLMRRGWAHEPVNGIYYITEAGLQAARNNPTDKRI